MKQCLQNNPRERPSTEQLLTRLQGVRGEVEGEYGGGAIKLDLARVRLAKEVKEKDRMIEELTEQQVCLPITPSRLRCIVIFGIFIRLDWRVSQMK